MSASVDSAKERPPEFRRRQRAVLVAGLLVLATPALRAGPPFTTDDPVPVDYRNGEFYIAAWHTRTADGWSGAEPAIELNYGIITNVQLHLIAPLAYDAPDHGAAHYGYGDTELGVKFRFLPETTWLPQAAVFPLAEAPTGNRSDGLGSGQWQAFLPLWLQKSFGDWTVYGGGGYWINPGTGNQNWGYVGTVLQYQVRDNLLVGGEIYHHTAPVAGGRADTAFNLGVVYDFSNHHHLLFSAGRSIDGPTDFQVYAAWQFTFGPEFFRSLAGVFRK